MSAAPVRILGIDPGIGRCGWGVIEESFGKAKFLAAGVIETPPGTPLPSRLVELRCDFLELLEEWQPARVGIEKLFFSKNISTGIAVAAARGVLLEAAAGKGFPLVEVQPQAVKMATTGNGAAPKKQVQEATARLLNLDKIPRPDDAADALSVALAAGRKF